MKLLDQTRPNCVPVRLTIIRVTKAKGHPNHVNHSKPVMKKKYRFKKTRNLESHIHVMLLIVVAFYIGNFPEHGFGTPPETWVLLVSRAYMRGTV